MYPFLTNTYLHSFATKIETFLIDQNLLLKNSSLLNHVWLMQAALTQKTFFF